jgi:hypothetical protein
LPVPLQVIRATKVKPNQELYLEYENGILILSPDQITEKSIVVKIEQLEHSPEGCFITFPTEILAKLLFKPRQIFNVSVSENTFQYDPYNKDFGYIGRERRYIFDTNPKILKEFRSEDRAAECEIYNLLFNNVPNASRLEWMREMNIH